MTGDINIKSILGSLAITAFLILISGIYYKYGGNPNFNIPNNVFVGAAIILGFLISIGVYATTDLGLSSSFAFGYIPAFIILGLITPFGWIFLFLDFIVLIIIKMYS